jgi:hypothetical protein
MLLIDDQKQANSFSISRAIGIIFYPFMLKHTMAKKKVKEEPSKNLQPPGDTPEKKAAIKAHDEAEKDIEKDPDLNSKPESGDDLDEGELARLEGED